MFELALERVFIVEDNELLLRIYRSVFESLGCRAAHATNAAQALRLLPHRHPDLIIVDDILPDASGAELVSQLRSSVSFRDVPIVAVGTSATASGGQAMREAGCDEFLAKPIQIEAFKTTVRRYLDCMQDAAVRPGRDAAPARSQPFGGERKAPPQPPPGPPERDGGPKVWRYRTAPPMPMTAAPPAGWAEPQVWRFRRC